MKNSFIYKFTNNDSLIDNILKKYKMEEIIKNPYSLIEFINLDEIDKVITNDKSFNELELKSNSAKNGWTWPPITEILGQIKRFYLDTKNGKYLDTFLDKPLNQFYLS